MAADYNVARDCHVTRCHRRSPFSLAVDRSAFGLRLAFGVFVVVRLPRRVSVRLLPLVMVCYFGHGLAIFAIRLAIVALCAGDWREARHADPVDGSSSCLDTARAG